MVPLQVEFHMELQDETQDDSRTTKSLVLAFDLDNTLLDSRRTNYGDVQSIARQKPIIPNVARARAWLRQGNEIVVITGRRESLVAVTRLQVAVLLDPGVRVVLAPEDSSWRDLVDYKARALTDLGGSCSLVAFVGDSRFDRAAAQASGVQFVHADGWGEGNFLPNTPMIPSTEKINRELNGVTSNHGVNRESTNKITSKLQGDCQ